MCDGLTASTATDMTEPWIFERADGVIYRRAFGADPATREVVGYESGQDYDPYKDPRTSDGSPLIDHLRDDKLWGEIRRAARSNATLQDALDRVIEIYNLTKTQ